MFKIVAAAALVCVGAASVAPAEAARICRNSHGRYFKCHRALAPRINLKAKHPVEVLRCRNHRHGRFNRC